MPEVLIDSIIYRYTTSCMVIVIKQHSRTLIKYYHKDFVLQYCKKKLRNTKHY